ncbi:universal stress protein [Streptomyces sp. LN245]|uniref:universal stress protein n=1 Tax=Streptomyces sp. LN245 TaxID=3112975 RepID=UPI00371BED08
MTTELVQAHSPAGALVDASADTDLLVVGARRPAHSLGNPLGHVTHAVLHHAHCPLVVVPSHVRPHSGD